MRKSIIVFCLALVVSSVASASADPAKPNAEQAKVTVPLGPSGTWTGKQGDMPKSLRSGWGIGNQVYVLSQNTVFHSSDRGLTWDAQELNIDGTAMWASSANDVWAMGKAAAHSTDQGKTWEVSRPFGENFEVYDVWGPNAQEIYAVGYGKTIYYSKDTGKTFKPLLPPIKAGRFFSIVGHGKELFLAGHESDGERRIPLLLVSKDKGKNWTRRTAPKTKRDTDMLTGLCFLDSGKIVVTTDYEVFVSSNQGKAWKSTKQTTGGVLSLACTGQEVFVSGKNRTFYHSRDEGTSWSDDELKDLFVDNLRTAMYTVFVTDGGDVYVGGDGIFSLKSGSLFRRAK